MTQPIDPAAAPPVDPSANPSWTPSVLSGAPAATPEEPQPDAAGLAAGASEGPVAAPTEYTSESTQEASQPSPGFFPNFDRSHPVQSWEHEGAREWNLLKLNAEDDWRHVSNVFTAAGFAPDQSYRLPQYGTPQWNALTQGIPEEQWSAFGNAVSAQHAQFIRQQILADLHSEQQMAQAPTLSRFVTQFADPESLALLAIPGVGEEMGVGRIAKFLIGGTQLAAENVALTVLQDQGKYVSSPHDVLDAAVNGFLLHGAVSTLGAIGGAALDRAGIAAKRAVALNQLSDLVEQGRVAPAEVRPEVLPEMHQGDLFGPDSASAARAGTVVAPAVELNPETAPNAVPQSALVGNGFLGAVLRGKFSPFRTFDTVLRGSDNPVVRSRLGRMFGATFGAEGQSAATVGASDYAQMLTHQYETRLGQIDVAHKSAWMQEQGFSGMFQRYDRDVQHQWSTAVAQEIRGIDTGSKAAKAAAGKYAALFDDVRAQARRAGVAGFEHLDTNENYLPRAFDFERIKQVNKAIGDNGMVKFLADSLQSSNPEMEREVAEAISKGYLQRTKRLALGIDQQMMNGVRLSDVEYIRDMLRDTPDVDSNQVDGVLDMLKRDMQKRGSDEGSLRMAKHRVQFDETHSLDVPELGRVRMADLFSNDAHALTSRYIRTMSGAIGLAKVGIRDDSDFARSLRESLSSLGESGAGHDEIETTRKYAEGGYKLLLGRPLDHDGFGAVQQATKALREYAFARSMGRGGFSIANNLIRPWTNGYARYTMKYMPALADIFSRRDAATGELLDPLARDIERYTGLGADSVSMSVFSHYENDGTVGRALDKVSHGLKVAGRATAHFGGLTPGLVFGQRMMAVGILDRIVRHAFGEATLPASRLAMMGLDQPMLDRIAAQLREHAPDIEGNAQRIRSVNWANWTDLDARDAMLTGINREARQLIHGEDIASTGLWMNKTWGRLAIQLRRFPMMAMHKQLARALTDRDLNAVMDFALTGTVGAASMWAQAHLMTAGMNPEDRAKYLEENAAPGRLFAAFLQRNPYSGMLPQMVDAISSGLTGHPVFDARATGLSGGIGGIPSLDAGSQLYNTLTGLVHNGTLTQRQIHALVEALPLGNSLPAVWLANALADHFPKEQPKEPDAHKGPWLQ